MKKFSADLGLTIGDMSEHSNAGPEWHWFEDALLTLDTTTHPGWLTCDALYRKSREGNTGNDGGPKLASTGFLDRFVEEILNAAIDNEQLLQGVVITQIENGFLAGALERRGFTLFWEAEHPDHSGHGVYFPFADEVPSR